MRAGKCFIPGDATHEKRGQFIEGVSQVHDDSDVNYQLSWGFTHLQLCYWDGIGLLHTDFSLHREAGKNKNRPFGLLIKTLKQYFHKVRCKLGPGHRRKNE
jgi:hypothetical protein